VKVLELRERADLERLRPEWEKILGQSASETIFLTGEWVNAWWGSYGKAGELSILAAVDEEGVMRGIAPLRRQTLRRSGQSRQALIFIGDGTTDSDYLDFIIERGYEPQVLEAFHRYWMSQVREGSIVALNEIPATSPHLPLLKTLAARDGMLWSETDVPCGTVHLPETWEAYLAMLRPRFRTKVRSVLRNFEKREEVKFGFCENAEQLDRLLPALFDLHTRRWAQDGKAGVFTREGKCDFYRALSPALLNCNRLRFSWLEWNGRILACQYGFVYNGAYSQLQEGYEPAAEHWNSGAGLRAWSIRRLIEEGVREYDFLGGIGRHKTDWGAEVKYSKQIVMARRNWKNLLFCRGREWEEQTKELLKKAAPERLLAAYKAGRARQQPTVEASDGAAGPQLPANDWRRKAVANGYFNLGLPAVMRPLRERYQVSVSSSGPRISLARRTQPSGRILYYHRVNDDRDPFFPAISTSLFEQEMRHLARHYKVVAMPELLKHLKDGPPETVVAITFDDGYRDNYENAFPILQRYNLPATIFLTTGTMDFDDPIWFEQLADAVKKTPLEVLDLEIDIPRRFFLRTQAERLDANNRIFGVLRDLPDTERKHWLPRILHQLRMADDGERHEKMLTWDQARHMSTSGIDFGGHTVNHPFLSRLTRENACWETSECKRRIEAELQLPVGIFAYPNGREKDLGPWSSEVIRSAGYCAAVTTIWGMNYQSTDSMHLKRGGPWEESQALFAYKLDWYQLVDD
jgi:peptidoglycan/xylan/chitin deacetylase (PgdA/CDA1 family)/CelD/BcsL family acetyltransferase involved in cellulose biosynthesis